MVTGDLELEARSCNDFNELKQVVSKLARILDKEKVIDLELATDSLKNQLNDIKNRLDDVEKAL
jgi:acetolactate synthase small subunit